jgi:2-dehydropantoate 2-reductase
VTDGPITVVGAGAIGGFVGARLLNAGHDVRFVEANREHVAAIRADGLRVTGALSLRVWPDVALPHEVGEGLGLVLLAVKAQDTVTALEPIVPGLTPDSLIVSLQNGLEEYRIAAAVGQQRTIGASLTFGGHYEAPGTIAYAGPGSFHLGELDGSMTERLERLATVLSAVHPVEPTSHILAHLWGKAAVGAYYFATALVDADVLDILADDRRLPPLGQLVAEVARVAAAEGLVCEPVDGFDPDAFLHADESGIRSSWDAQRRYWLRLETRRTGVWRDLWLARRKTEVAAILGPVLERARLHGVETPGLDGLLAEVEAAEASNAGLEPDPTSSGRGAAVGRPPLSS